MNNFEFKKMLNNFMSLFFSHFFKLLLSVLFSLIVPKFLTVESYGFVQLFLFYSSYIYIISLGWVNGIYLRYGGLEYNKIDKKRIGNQFWIYCLIQTIIFIIIIIISQFIINESSQKFIISFTFIYGIFFSPIYFISNLFQATNKIQQVSKMFLIERVTYSICMVILLFLDLRDYRLWIIISVIAQFFELLVAFWFYRDFLFKGFYFNLTSIVESKKNISAGFKLMIANMTSMLIIGIIRFGIEYKWDTEIFGKVSLTLSISNFLMIFISSIGVVIFPIIKNMSKEIYVKTYILIENILMIASFGVLIFYYPIARLLSYWLPEYTDGLRYMALLFPICVFEGKSSMLITTYMKALRLEKKILQINILSVFITIIASVITITIFENLTLAILSIVIVQAFKCIYSEYILSKVINICVFRTIIFELILSICFILINWNVKGWGSILMYFSCYLAYIILNQKKMKRSIELLKSLYRKEIE